MGYFGIEFHTRSDTMSLARMQYKNNSIKTEQDHSLLYLELFMYEMVYHGNSSTQTNREKIKNKH